MLFEVIHDVAMYDMFKKLRNHRCQAYWSVIGCFCYVSILYCLIFDSFQALRICSQSDVMYHRCYMGGISF